MTSTTQPDDGKLPERIKGVMLRRAHLFLEKIDLPTFQQMPDEDQSKFVDQVIRLYRMTRHWLDAAVDAEQMREEQGVEDLPDPEEGECIFCSGPYEYMGNNPWPLADVGRCCRDCNELVVQARIGLDALREAAKKTVS